MNHCNNRHDRWGGAIRNLLSCILLFIITTTAGCSGKLPSANLQQRSFLPIPPQPKTQSLTAQDDNSPRSILPSSLPSNEKKSQTESNVPETQPKIIQLSARSLIPTTFKLHPNIKSSYQRFKSEEARYDFFYVSRDTLTPRVRTISEFDEQVNSSSKGGKLYDRTSTTTVEASVEKRFFDTTRIELGSGLDSTVDNGDDGYQPFIFANLRYPLGGSRERLERASEDIFRRNELDDAQLEYIDTARSLLRRALEQFYETIELEKRSKAAQRWVADLNTLDQTASEIKNRDTTNDRRRIQAELTQAAADARNLQGRYDVEMVRLKSATGVNYQDEIQIHEDSFNPFLGKNHDDIMALAIKQDPEIATLTNAVSNARVQFDLAKKGKYDVALTAAGQTHLRGGGTAEDENSWMVSAGLDVSVVDERVTSSLKSQALANIMRFSQSIEARRREIFVSTFDPLIRIETLTASRDALIANLGRYENDYQTGVQEYIAGNLNIDNLLIRRQTLFSQQEQIAELTNAIGSNVAELGEATGLFFEMLDENTPKNTMEKS